MITRQDIEQVLRNLEERRLLAAEQCDKARALARQAVVYGGRCGAPFEASAELSFERASAYGEAAHLLRRVLEQGEQAVGA